MHAFLSKSKISVSIQKIDFSVSAILTLNQKFSVLLLFIISSFLDKSFIEFLLKYWRISMIQFVFQDTDREKKFEEADVDA